MCGITGIVDTIPIDPTILKKATDILSYRGPDDQNRFVDEKVGFGHNRLAIIDIKGGVQPMEHNGVVLSFNGQIYNFKRLLPQLEKNGVKMETNSDTEVLLKLFIQERTKSFKMLNGMFAFSIWDDNSKSLYLVRDRSGIKPLYYAQINTKLIFASEIKAILLHPEFETRKLNHKAFHFFFNLRYVPDEYTFFEGIKQLKPGHYLTWKDGKISIKRFWQLSDRIKYNSAPDAAKVLRKLLEDTIDLHLISDIEVGAFLSGGIDSSSIVALASKKVEGLKTFTLGFNQDTDELKKARLTAEYYNTDHYEKIIPSTFLDNSVQVLWHSEYPKRGLYRYDVAQLASEKVNVVLSGLGSDELFGGYIWKYRQIGKNLAFCKKYPEKVKELKKYALGLTTLQSKYGRFTDDSYLDYLENNAYIDNSLEAYVKKISLDEVFNEDRRMRVYGETLKRYKFPNIAEEMRKYFTGSNPYTSVLKADFFSKMIGDFLHIEDRMAMAFSVESRVPYLENKMIDFAFSVNPKLHIQGQGKHILRLAMNSDLPKWVKEAPKQGFSIHLSEEYTKKIINYGKLLLSNGHIVKNKLLASDYLNKILNYPISSGLTKHYYVLWNLLFFEIWYEIFMERKCTSIPKFKLDDLI